MNSKSQMLKQATYDHHETKHDDRIIFLAFLAIIDLIILGVVAVLLRDLTTTIGTILGGTLAVLFSLIIGEDVRWVLFNRKWFKDNTKDCSTKSQESTTTDSKLTE